MGNNCSIQLINISSLYRTLSDLPKSYREVSEVMQENYFRYENEVLFKDSIDKTRSMEHTSILNDMETLYSIFDDASNSLLDRYLEYFITKLMDQTKGNIFIAKNMLSEICITLTRKLYKLTGIQTDVTGNINQLLNDINELDDAKQTLEYLKNYLNLLRDKMKDDRKNYSPIVRNVLEYMYSNYPKDISLDSVGEKFTINPSYLSRLFKKRS